MNWELLGRIADVAGIVGIFVSAVAAVKAASAAKAAKDAKAALLRSVIADDLLVVIGMMGELKRLQREENWELALDRYHSIQQSLGYIAATHPSLSSDQRETLRLVIDEIRRLENVAEMTVPRRMSLAKRQDLTAAVSKTVDKLIAVRAELTGTA